MDFSNFIQPYLQTVYLLDREEGEWQGGIWVPGTETEIPFEAAITTFSDDHLAFGDSGTFTENDRKLYTYKKLERGQKIKANDEVYTVTAERDYSFYARGLRMYIVKRDGVASD